MEVILTLLLCALGFFIYLTDRNKHEILLLKQELRDRDIEIETLRDELRKKATKPPPKKKPSKLSLPPPSSEIFVSVIFKEHDTKFYDYLLGDNRDVQVGDFVEVYFNNKSSGKVERRVAKVIYVSKPGEVSEYARSNIKRKADYPKW